PENRAGCAPHPKHCLLTVCPSGSFSQSQSSFKPLYFKPRMQPVQDRFIELRFDGFDLELLDQLFGETISQQVAREFHVQSATQEIEQLFLFELPDGRAVRTFHIVGENLKLWLCIYARLCREQQVLVRLLRVRLLRIAVDEDLAVEASARLAIKDALIKLAACALRSVVMNERVRVRMLTSAAEIETINRARRG